MRMLCTKAYEYWNNNDDNNYVVWFEKKVHDCLIVLPWRWCLLSKHLSTKLKQSSSY